MSEEQECHNLSQVTACRKTVANELFWNEKLVLVIKIGSSYKNYLKFCFLFSSQPFMYGDYIAYDCWLGKVYDLKNQVILKLSNGARYFSPSCGRLSPLVFTILICFMRTRNSLGFIYIVISCLLA